MTGEPDPPGSDDKVRLLLLELGSDLLGGGLPVNEVEDALRRLGAALEKPHAAVAAFPTGLFITLEPAAAAGFRPVGAPLRFEQTADILNLGHHVSAGDIDANEALTTLRQIRRSAPRWPAWVSDFGSLPVGVGLCLLLQPALANIIAALAGSLIVAGLTTIARRSVSFRPLLPIVAAFIVSVLIMIAAETSLLTGALRTIVAALAILLPGSLLVTGLSEVAAGAASAGSADWSAAACS